MNISECQFLYTANVTNMLVHLYIINFEGKLVLKKLKNVTAIYSYLSDPCILLCVKYP